MARLHVIVLAFCLVQVYAKAAAPSKDHIEELNKETQHVVKTLTDTFHDVTGIKDTDEMKKVRETIHSSVNDLAEKMTGVMKTLGSEAKAHSGEVEQAINSLKEKFTEGVKKIQEDHPKEVEEVKKHQKKIEEFYNDAAARIKTTMEAINKDTEGVQKDIGSWFENLATTFKTNAEKMGEDLKKVVAEHQKEHH